MTDTDNIYAQLFHLTGTLDAVENARIGLSNRLDTLTSTDERGFGLPEDEPSIDALAETVAFLKAREGDLSKQLERLMKQHPLHGFIKSQRYLGLKTVARLLGIVGDPAIHPVTSDPRTFGQLVSFCGLAPIDGIGARRRKGQVVTYNPEARKRLWIMASTAIRDTKGGPYRLAYDDARKKHAAAVHAVPCVNCGTTGKPAAAGTPLSLGHQHGRGYRAVMRRMLRDLWVQGRAVHGWHDIPPPGTVALEPDPQSRSQGVAEPLWIAYQAADTIP